MFEDVVPHSFGVKISKFASVSSVDLGKKGADEGRARRADVVPHTFGTEVRCVLLKPQAARFESHAAKTLRLRGFRRTKPPS